MLARASHAVHSKPASNALSKFPSRLMLSGALFQGKNGGIQFTLEILFIVFRYC